jgi:FKBP-type peptidyl-prolyl cis-trans isomerase
VRPAGGRVCQRVGSRILLVIPPRLAYGKAGNPPTIQSTDTLIFVIDILAATHG